VCAAGLLNIKKPITKPSIKYMSPSDIFDRIR
jgi:hypothetical protein